MTLTKGLQFTLKVLNRAHLLFFNHMLLLNNVMEHFYWLAAEAKFEIYCGCAWSRAKNANKNSEQRNLSGFITTAFY